MADDVTTSLTLVNLSTGFSQNTASQNGTLAWNAHHNGVTGYTITTKTSSSGLSYDVIDVVTSEVDSDPPALMITIAYGQTGEVPELDLDVKYTQIPANSELSVVSSDPAFDIGRQQISGSASVGIPVFNVSSLEMTSTINLWFTQPGALSSASTLLVTFSSIETGSGPVKKTVLQQLQINLRPSPKVEPTRLITAAAAQTWTGIVVRCTLSENGTVPRNSSSQSPDVIITSPVPFQDPAMLTNPANYGNAYSNDLYIGQQNYLYVRGKNYTTGQLQGTWSLFWATPNILLYPFMWQQNALKTSDGNANPPFTIAAGAIGASENPFTWVPPNVSDHYCLIGLASTPDHGNPVEGVNNITSLATVLSNNANIAQRNVQMVRGQAVQYVNYADYYQGDEGALVDLTAVFQNIPKGSSYTIASGTPLNGQPLSHQDSNTTDYNFKWGWVDQNIPAQWLTRFTITMNFGSDWSGIPPTSNPMVTIRGELVQGMADPLFHLGRPAGLHPVTKRARVHPVTGGPVVVVPVGSVTCEYMDARRK